MVRHADGGAIVAYRRALESGAADPGEIELALAALGAETSPVVAPKQHVTSLFDKYAETFDQQPSQRTEISDARIAVRRDRPIRAGRQTGHPGAVAAPACSGRSCARSPGR